MSDEIAELGLNNRQFNQAIDESIRQVRQLPPVVAQAGRGIQNMERQMDATGRAAYNLGHRIGTSIGGAIARVGKGLLGLVGLGSFVSLIGKIQDAQEAAETLNAEIEKIGIDRGNPDFRTLDELESRLKRINGVLAQLQGGPSKGIGGYVKDATSVVGQMVDNVQNYASQGKYFDAMNSAFDPSFAAKQIAAQRGGQQSQLTQEKEVAEKNIAYKKEQKLIEDTRDFESKQHQEFLVEKDRMTEAQREHDRQQYQGHLNEQDKKAREFSEKAAQDEIDFRKDVAEENKKHDEDKLARLEKEKELVKQIGAENRRNAQIQREANNEADLANNGNPQAANKERIRNQGRRDINDALNSGSVDEAREIARKMDREIAEENAAEAAKSPSERRAERNSGRSYKRGINSGERRIKDLDDRIARGARGDENSSLEQRRREMEQFGPTPDEVKGGIDDKTTLSDLKTELKNIYNTLKPKN